MDYEEYTNEAVRLRPELVAAARRYLGNEADAEDAVQEVLLKLWTIHDTFVGNTGGMAHRMLRNHCISVLRRKRPSVSIDDVEWDVAESGVDADSVADADVDDMAEMMAVVDALPDYQQTVLRLRHIDGMSMDDIAALTGTSAANIRQTLSRARRSARRQYLLAHRWKIAGIVATIAVVFSIGMWHDHREVQRLEARYGGSYVIVGGKKNSNLREILPDVVQALAQADTDDATYDAQRIIEEAEAEARKYLGQPHPYSPNVGEP